VNAPHEPSENFEERLKAARAKSGLDAAAAKPPGPAPWGQGVRAGVELVSGVLVGTAMGWGIDWLTGLSPLFLILFLVLGFVAGVMNVVRLFSGRPGRRWSGRD
jgi:ATP synthase protein I